MDQDAILQLERFVLPLSKSCVGKYYQHKAMQDCKAAAKIFQSKFLRKQLLDPLAVVFAHQNSNYFFQEGLLNHGKLQHSPLFEWAALFRLILHAPELRDGVVKKLKSRTRLLLDHYFKHSAFEILFARESFYEWLHQNTTLLDIIFDCQDDHAYQWRLRDYLGDDYLQTLFEKHAQRKGFLGRCRSLLVGMLLRRVNANRVAAMLGNITISENLGHNAEASIAMAASIVSQQVSYMFPQDVLNVIAHFRYNESFLAFIKKSLFQFIRIHRDEGLYLLQEKKIVRTFDVFALAQFAVFHAYQTTYLISMNVLLAKHQLALPDFSSLGFSKAMSKVIQEASQEQLVRLATRVDIACLYTQSISFFTYLLPCVRVWLFEKHVGHPLFFEQVIIENLLHPQGRIYPKRIEILQQLFQSSETLKKTLLKNKSFFEKFSKMPFEKFSSTTKNNRGTKSLL